MSDRVLRGSVVAIVVVAVMAVVALVAWRLSQEGEGSGRGKRGTGDPAPAPVAVAPVTSGAIVERLTVSGTLEPAAAFLVAPRVGGRLVGMPYHVGDAVERGTVIAQLDDARYGHAVQEARAAVAVAAARASEARSQVGIARRAAERAAKLAERGVASEAELDNAQAAHLAADAAVAVAEAGLAEAEATLASAELDLSECQVRATWDGDDPVRVVGQRFVDAGETVDGGQALVSVLDIDPLIAVIQVDESTYGQLVIGQDATLGCDAYPDRRFAATVLRIAPRFDPRSRQARVELAVPNGDHRLKPGMYVRVALELARVDDATLVPEAALVRRSGADAVFVLNDDRSTVRLVPVRVGLREAGRVQVSGDGLGGEVVVLGQQLIGDGSAVIIAAAKAAADGEAVTP